MAGPCSVQPVTPCCQAGSLVGAVLPRALSAACAPLLLGPPGHCKTRKEHAHAAISNEGCPRQNQQGQGNKQSLLTRCTAGRLTAHSGLLALFLLGPQKGSERRTAAGSGCLVGQEQSPLSSTLPGFPGVPRRDGTLPGRPGQARQPPGTGAWQGSARPQARAPSAWDGSSRSAPPGSALGSPSVTSEPPL